MQIPCKRFGCQKAVEVCYWSCRYRKSCKDWRQALEAEPGEAAIRARLESASARTGRAFDVATLVLPGRKRRKKKEMEGGNKSMAKSAAPESEETEIVRPAAESGEKTPNEKVQAEKRSSAAQFAKKQRQPGAKRTRPAVSGTVYLLLSPNGKYRELREDELATEAAHLLKDPSLRLVKGQFLIPQITFRPADE
jgi:hypothetical protein